MKRFVVLLIKIRIMGGQKTKQKEFGNCDNKSSIFHKSEEFWWVNHSFKAHMRRGGEVDMFFPVILKMADGGAG